MTIHEALSEGRAVLRSALESEILLAFLLKKPREYFIAHPQDVVTKKASSLYMRKIQERSRGVPVAYLTGHKEFFKLDFLVNRGVLIPRPETELLVEEAIRITREYGRVSMNDGVLPGEYFRGSIADVGTGSGCIAISLAKHLPFAKICAVDRSSSALSVAKKNAKRHRVSSRIDFVKSDLLAAVAGRPFDGIVANLPYIGTRENHLVEKQVLENEPKMALFGGRTGLELFERLFRQMRDLPRGPAWFIAEIGFLQRPSITALIKKYFGDIKVLWKNDLSGIPRMFILNF